MKMRHPCLLSVTVVLLTLGTFVGVGQTQPSFDLAQIPLPSCGHPSEPPAESPVPHLDFSGAAQRLGVTKAILINALGLQPKPILRCGQPADPQPTSFTLNQNASGMGVRRKINFAAAAQKLGVTEATLKEALGLPPSLPDDRPTNPSSKDHYSPQAATDQSI